MYALTDTLSFRHTRILPYAPTDTPLHPPTSTLACAPVGTSSHPLTGTPSHALALSFLPARVLPSSLSTSTLPSAPTCAPPYSPTDTPSEEGAEHPQILRRNMRQWVRKHPMGAPLGYGPFSVGMDRSLWYRIRGSGGGWRLPCSYSGTCQLGTPVHVQLEYGRSEVGRSGRVGAAAWGMRVPLLQKRGRLVWRELPA